MLAELQAHRNAKPMWHALGFVGCHLIERSDYILRIHYWPSHARKPKWPNWQIHDHRFDVFSTVLTGSLQDMRFTFVPGAGEKRLLQVSYEGDESRLIDDGQKGDVELISAERYGSGDQYLVPAGALHSSDVSFDAEAVTLVQCVNFVDQAPRVVADSSDQPKPYLRTEYDALAFWQRVQRALAECTDQR